MEKKKDAAALHAPRMADMVRHCHRMAAVRGGGHMRRYFTTGRHGPGCQRQPRGRPPDIDTAVVQPYGCRLCAWLESGAESTARDCYLHPKVLFPPYYIA